MMKKFLIIALFIGISTPALAEYVGYYHSNEMYAPSHESDNPDSTGLDNNSYKGMNSHTGVIGTNRYEHDDRLPYFSGISDNNGNLVGSAAMYGQPDPYAYQQSQRQQKKMNEQQQAQQQFQPIQHIKPTQPMEAMKPMPTQPMLSQYGAYDDQYMPYIKP